MINTLVGVGIGYLIFKWADSEPINTPSSPEDDSTPQDPTPPQRAGVWSLESVSNVKRDSDSEIYYACGTYAYDEGRTGTYSYIVVQSDDPEGPLSSWSQLMGSDGSIAYTFVLKTDCVQMVNELTREPTPDDPQKQPEPEEEKPTLPPSNPLPDFGGMNGFGEIGSGWY